MYYSILVVCILLNVILSEQQRTALKAPTVIIALDEVGFHRKISYTVEFDYTMAGKNCKYILKQFLPADIYISTDQLDDLKRTQKLNALYPSFVNIELSTERSRSFDVLLQGTPKITETFILPIHFRYHAPRDYTSFVTVELTKPEMYFKCLTNDYVAAELLENEEEEEEEEVDNIVKYCFNLKQASITQYNNNRNTSDWDCNWMNMKVHFQVKTSLSAKIPVGNKQAYYPAFYITIALSWIMTLWIILRTYHIPQRINEKLQHQREQQQLLQHK